MRSLGEARTKSRCGCGRGAYLECGDTCGKLDGPERSNKHGGVNGLDFAAAGSDPWGMSEVAGSRLDEVETKRFQDQSMNDPVVKHGYCWELLEHRCAGRCNQVCYKLVPSVNCASIDESDYSKSALTSNAHNLQMLLQAVQRLDLHDCVGSKYNEDSLLLANKPTKCNLK